MISIKNNGLERETSIKTYPLKKTSSAAALILHGDPTFTKMDSLQSFQKNYATIDREIREKHEARKKASIEDRKNINLEREKGLKDQEGKILEKITLRQINSQKLYKIGEKETILKGSLPVNPINSQFQDNDKAKRLALRDQQRNLNRLVRAHYLQTMGSSGYNIVTGRNSVDVHGLVPERSQAVYEEKLNRMYSRYRINPENS